MKRIGEILIENGSINATQLDAALKFQKTSPGKLIGKILIDLGYVTEEEIVIALSTQFNVPYLSLGNFIFNEQVSEKIIPPELVAQYLCIPLERNGNLITIVMSDPTQEGAIHAIEEATKAKVQVFVSTPTEIAKVLERIYHIDVNAGQPKAVQKS